MATARRLFHVGGLIVTPIYAQFLMDTLSWCPLSWQGHHRTRWRWRGTIQDVPKNDMGFTRVCPLGFYVRIFLEKSLQQIVPAWLNYLQVLSCSLLLCWISRWCIHVIDPKNVVIMRSNSCKAHLGLARWVFVSQIYWPPVQGVIVESRGVLARSICCIKGLTINLPINSALC